MNAIRPDETIDNTHSIYVDQWDWEKVLAPEERRLQTLQAAVEAIYDVICRAEFHIASQHSHIRPLLPARITFITSEALCARYPHLSPRQREDRICAEHKAVFVIGIGGLLADGQPHDGRAPDDDDWTTPHGDGGCGLNGDILLWHPVLERAFEISSMGIRVDPPTLLHQLAQRQTIQAWLGLACPHMQAPRQQPVGAVSHEVAGASHPPAGLTAATPATGLWLERPPNAA